MDILRSTVTVHEPHKIVVVAEHGAEKHSQCKYSVLDLSCRFAVWLWNSNFTLKLIFTILSVINITQLL